jgi:hypothetical protein
MISTRYHKKNITNSTNVFHRVMPSELGVSAITTHPRWSQGPSIWGMGHSFGESAWGECLLWERLELLLPKVQWTWGICLGWVLTLGTSWVTTTQSAMDLELSEEMRTKGTMSLLGEKSFSHLSFLVFFLSSCCLFPDLSSVWGETLNTTPHHPPKSSSVQRPFWAWQCSLAEENRVVLLKSLTFLLW